MVQHSTSADLESCVCQKKEAIYCPAATIACLFIVIIKDHYVGT